MRRQQQQRHAVSAIDPLPLAKKRESSFVYNIESLPFI